MDLGFNYFDVVIIEASDFGEITLNNDHYAFRCHSILIPVESPYAISDSE